MIGAQLGPGSCSGESARDHTSALCGAITASHPMGIGTHGSAVYAVNPIPVKSSSVAADRAFIGSAPHHASTAATARTPVTTHSVIVCTVPTASAEPAMAAASTQRLARVIGVEPALPWLPVVVIVRLGEYLRLSVAADLADVRIAGVAGAAFPAHPPRSRLSGTGLGQPGTCLGTAALPPTARISTTLARARLLLWRQGAPLRSQMPTPPPHDALFKAAFGQADLARSELELVLPVEVQAHLDLATLEISPGSFVDDDLRHAHTDLLYRVRTRSEGDALVYLLMEHQSTFEARMPLRLLRYMVRVWDRWERDHPTGKLPIVFPVVLHHELGGRRAAPEFASILDASPDLLAAVGPFQPLFRFVLDDLAIHSLEAISSRKVHALTLLVELAFWASRSFGRLNDAAPRMGAIVAELKLDARARTLLTQLYVYLLRDAPADVETDDVRAILEQIAGPRGKEEIVNAGERLIEQGRAEGLAKGQAEGLVKGQAEGLAKGQAEGLRAAVAVTMAARGLALSELGRARLAACSDVTLLTAWVTCAVTAATEADVFDTR